MFLTPHLSIYLPAYLLVYVSCYQLVCVIYCICVSEFLPVCQGVVCRAVPFVLCAVMCVVRTLRAVWA